MFSADKLFVLWRSVTLRLSEAYSNEIVAMLRAQGMWQTRQRAHEQALRLPDVALLPPKASQGRSTSS